MRVGLLIQFRNCTTGDVVHNLARTDSEHITTKVTPNATNTNFLSITEAAVYLNCIISNLKMSASAPRLQHSDVSVDGLTLIELPEAVVQPMTGLLKHDFVLLDEALNTGLVIIGLPKAMRSLA